MAEDDGVAVPVEDPADQKVGDDESSLDMEDQQEGSESWFKRKILGDYDYG